MWKDLEEKCLAEHEWYDTISDVLNLDIIDLSLQEYVKYIKQEYPHADYDDMRKADILREILSSGETDNREIFFSILKESLSGTETRLMVCMILSITHLQDSIRKTPSTIQALAKESILTVIEKAEEEKMWPQEEENYNRYDGIKNLLEIGFPCITKEWYLVYYMYWGESEKVCVWSDELWAELWIDKFWTILEQQEIEEIDAWAEFTAWKYDQAALHKRKQESGVTHVVDGGSTKWWSGEKSHKLSVVQ